MSDLEDRHWINDQSYKFISPFIPSEYKVFSEQPCSMRIKCVALYQGR